MESKIEIIAEVANAHQGSPELALKIAENSVIAGADAVKFQIYSGKDLLVRKHPRFEHFYKQAFSVDEWGQLLSPLVSRGLSVYCDVLGLDAMRIAHDLGVSGIKIHSSDLANLPLLEKAAQWGGQILLGTGGSTAREINLALSVLDQTHVRPILMHGFQAYPTLAEDSELNRLKWLTETYGDRADTGYMDHVAADDIFSTVLPAMAISLGVSVIEKHVTLDRAAKGVDYYSSLDVPQEFAVFTKDIRRTEAALGDDIPRFSDAEIKYRSTVKKHWVTTHSLPEGHILSQDDLVMKRVNDSISEPLELKKLLKKRLVVPLDKETPVSRNQINRTTWALVIARLFSTRLPKKALISIAGMPALSHLFERLKQAKSIDEIVLCTTTNNEDDELILVAENHGIKCHRGPVDDVLGRMLGAVEGHSVDAIVRATADDILIDPNYLDRTVEHHFVTNSEYTDNKALPSGTEVEVFDTDLLQTIWSAAKYTGGTEYLTTYVIANKEQFRTSKLIVDQHHARDWRLTLDTAEDLSVINALLVGMLNKGKGLNYRLDDIVEFIENNHEILQPNAEVRQRQTPLNIDVSLNWADIR